MSWRAAPARCPQRTKGNADEAGRGTWRGRERMGRSVKQILITGVHSYVGENVRRWLEGYNAEHGEERYRVTMQSLREAGWETAEWKDYDSVFHVAGIAHADVGRASEETKERYYKVNRDLAVQAAKKARASGVRQFVYMSSVIVYGDSAPPGKKKRISEQTLPAPANFYGDSKLQAERMLSGLAGNGFSVAIVRAPMIYGRGSRGNFPLLVKLAERLVAFPSIANERSVLYIENLAEFLRLLAESGQGGIFFPQNAEYASTAQMVRLIAAAGGRRIRLWRILNPLVWLAGRMPGKAGGMAAKAFGSLSIDQSLSVREIDGYRIYSLEESIGRIYEG